jgi:hypothetical protein
MTGGTILPTLGVIGEYLGRRDGRATCHRHRRAAREIQLGGAIVTLQMQGASIDTTVSPRGPI